MWHYSRITTAFCLLFHFALLSWFLEIISLIFGHFLSGALDAHLEHYDTPTSGSIGRALHYLNIRRIGADRASVTRWPLDSSASLLSAWLGHAVATRAQQPAACSGEFYSCWSSPCVAAEKSLLPLRRDETTALAEDEFIGRWRLYTGLFRKCRNPAKANLPISSGRLTMCCCWSLKRAKNSKGDKGADHLPTLRNALLAELKPWPTVL